MKSIPAVLLVDTGVDDAFAIALAARSPQIELLGLVASFGNSKLENTLQNTLWLVQLLGVQAPVCKGSAHAFCEPDWVPEEGVVNCHGDRGLGPVVAPETLAVSPASEDAVAFLAGILERSQEPVALIPVGPLTDVARFVVARPDLIPKIRVISLMGGAGRGGNVTPFVEANISSDPEAAATVFGCGAPIVMCGLDCTRDCVVTAAMIEQLRGESVGAGPGPLRQRGFLSLHRRTASRSPSRGLSHRRGGPSDRGTLCGHLPDPRRAPGPNGG